MRFELDSKILELEIKNQDLQELLVNNKNIANSEKIQEIKESWAKQREETDQIIDNLIKQKEKFRHDFNFCKKILVSIEKDYININKKAKESQKPQNEIQKEIKLEDYIQNSLRLYDHFEKLYLNIEFTSMLEIKVENLKPVLGRKCFLITYLLPVKIMICWKKPLKKSQLKLLSMKKEYTLSKIC